MALKKTGTAPMPQPDAQAGAQQQPPPYAKSVKKADVEINTGAEDEDEEEEEDEDEAEKAKKSLVSEDDLQKSLDKLAAMASEGVSTSRKDALLRKAQVEELSKGENDELYHLLGGAAEAAAPSLSKSVQENFMDNDVLQKATDVSEYLDENQKALLKSLGTLAERIEAGDTRQHEFNLVLAKAMKGVGQLVKGMSERLGVIESQPVRGPKSKGIQPGQVLHKGFAGTPAANESLNHQQILEGLDALMQKSMHEGKDGFTAGGENILTATAKFEQTRQITPSMLQEITQFQRGQQH